MSPCPLVTQVGELGVNTDLVKLLDAIAPLKTIVIGEAMLDCYLAGFSDRMSPEAAVPVVTVPQQQQVPGGAANTAINVRLAVVLLSYR